MNNYEWQELILMENNVGSLFFFLLLCPVLEAQLSAIDALIDSMSLIKKNEEEDTIEDLFSTTKIPNPQFQRLFQVRKERRTNCIFLNEGELSEKLGYIL